MGNDLRQFFQKAKEEHFAIGAFNFSTVEQLRAIFEAAKELKSPIIIQTSPREADFLGIDLASEAVKVFRKRYNVLAFLNLDHAKNFEKIKEAINAGYDMVQFDGSSLSYQENLTKTKEVVDYAHSQDVLVEGELGYLGGSSTLHEKTPLISEKDYTDAGLVEDFVEKSQVDFLAIAVGNLHGIFKGGEGNPPLAIERIKEIREKTETFLSLHGGSGIEEQELRRAIEAGIVKININTELRLTYAEALRKALKEDETEITPYKYFGLAIEKVKKVVEEKIKIFGSINKAN